MFVTSKTPDNAALSQILIVFTLKDALGAIALEVNFLSSQPLDTGSIPNAAMSDRSFIVATGDIHLIAVVPACLSGLT